MLLLQERVIDARTIFALIKPAELLRELGEDAPASAPAAGSQAQQPNSQLQVQYDYISCYLDFSSAPTPLTCPSSSLPGAGSAPPAGGVQVGHAALAIARRYANHPVPRVRELFSIVEQHLQESLPRADMEHLAEQLGSPVEKRAQEMDALAATEPALSFTLLGGGGGGSSSSGRVRITHAHLGKEEVLLVHLYRIDLELLFSSSPFQCSGAEGATEASAPASATSDAATPPFLFLHPNHTIRLPLMQQQQKQKQQQQQRSEQQRSKVAAEGKHADDGGDEEEKKAPASSSVAAAAVVPVSSSALSVGPISSSGGTIEVLLPSCFSSSNLYVQVTSLRRPHLSSFQVAFQHRMRVAVAETFGRITVRAGAPLAAAAEAKADAEQKGSSSSSSFSSSASLPAGAPLPGVYCKVFAELLSGAVQFFKDGRTDLRGAFDYAALSTDKLKQVKRFSVLFMSKEHGALVRQAKPPIVA